MTGRCNKHQNAPKRAVDERRGSAYSRGYTHEWRAARAVWLRQHPLCVKCLPAVTAATVIDHIVPHRGNMGLFWDVSNWQSLCKQCHDRKTASGK